MGGFETRPYKLPATTEDTEKAEIIPMRAPAVNL
jgi:hypothetical protein